ncbi:MAG: Nucleotidyltransferase domain protein [Candidatus Bathyarchaeota archaeon BA2]|nr:MAG: Nucleotidyltransferase domain protein [Candidatus Bathyarchaeota archaeon BA2]
METKKRLRELINEYTRTCKELMCAVIYGSYALGEFTESSDIDLLLVTEDDRGMETFHELLNGRIVEMTTVGHKLFDEMVKDANPFIVGALIYGIPIYGKKVIEAAKKSLNDKTLKGWSEKYYKKGIERLKEAETDNSEAIAAVTLLLNAYLITSGDLRLSYSLDKLTGRIKDEDLRNLLNDFKKASEAKNLDYAKEIAKVVELKILE